MKSEKGVTLVSLLTYIAVLLTVMVIVGRITGMFSKNLNVIDSDNDASTSISKLNLCFLTETKRTEEEKNVEAIIAQMGKRGDTYCFPDNIEEPTEKNANGTAIKFIGSQSVIAYVEDKIYYNKIMVCDKVSSFNIAYNAAQKAVTVTARIGNQDFSQTYTYR